MIHSASPQSRPAVQICFLVDFDGRTDGRTGRGCGRPCELINVIHIGQDVLFTHVLTRFKMNPVCSSLLFHIEYCCH